MISIFTKHLPYKVGEQLKIEYDKRVSDIKNLTSDKYQTYTNMKEYLDVIYLLLAMSIFYRRILANFDAANKFTHRILSKSDATSIVLGTIELSEKEILQLNSVVYRYKKIMEKYTLSVDMFVYSNTLEFMRKVRGYKDFMSESNK
ncbi:hypothetical protein [Dysgonomonas sp. 520]|uniref:hypothetical protein n=1 Tax=Dysgonomonas sp. 520 TaxID=2302931 RepID=UPI0013D8442F|nr:hypothetical protein [Dysgonomonas sp. 520]MDL2302797.1 hypothetical protein [Dysgonomonas sp. OttesenSCG-928-D17]NDW10206.1 hypothetical protein [Dysgonomonas sp. 520]